jgi:Xaa-Pro aminopeptidase
MYTTDAFLISNFYNILYLTKFETLAPNEREAFLLLIGSKKIIITDARYTGEKHSADSELYILKAGQRVGDVIQTYCKENNCKTLGVEGENITWSEMQMVSKLGVEVVPLPHICAAKRSIKSEEELFAIKQACHIGDQVLRDITPYIHPGQTEKEIAWFIEKSIREGYGADLAFDPIIAVDANSAVPHYNTKKGDGVVQDTSLILIDFGVKAHNYCSDITRMVTVGDVSQEIITTYNNLLAAQTKTIQFAENTKNLVDIDAFCRGELAKASLPNYAHSTGHGIGLEVHESPRISAVSKEVKEVGQVFTIEPGVYYPGKWGMRIEDTVTVSAQREVEVLTRFPQELLRLKGM